MSQSAFRTDSPTDDATPPARRATPWWGWLLTVLAVAGTLVLEVAFRQIALWSYSGCEDGVGREVGQGQVALTIMWGVVSVAWLVPAWWTRWRVPVVGGAVLCSAVAALFVGQGLDPAWWNDGFCFTF